MINQANQIVLELAYTNASGHKEKLVVAIENDQRLTYDEVLQLFESVDWTAFHASSYGLSSPAKYCYYWQADGEDHALSDISAVMLGQWDTVDVRADEPISVIAENIRNCGCSKFAAESKAALVAEHKRLSQLLGEKPESVVITVGEFGKIESVITESEALELNCIVLDKNAEAIDNDVACDWYGERVWIYNLPSYCGADKVYHAQVLSDLSKNYDPLSRFKDFDECVDVSDASGEYVERVRYPANMSQEAIQNMINHLNVLIGNTGQKCSSMKSVFFYVETRRSYSLVAVL